MVRFWHRLPWQGRLVFLLIFYTLGITFIAHVGLFQMVGQMGLGVWLYWDPGPRCLRVSPLVSLEWPPIASGQLYPGDCLTRIDGKLFNHQPDLHEYLTQKFVGHRNEKQVHVEGYTSTGHPINAMMPVTRWRVADVLQAQLLNFIPGLGLWIIGLLVFLARPDQNLNQSTGAFFLLAGMLLMGINIWILYRTLFQEVV